MRGVIAATLLVFLASSPFSFGGSLGENVGQAIKNPAKEVLTKRISADIKMKAGVYCDCDDKLEPQGAMLTRAIEIHVTNEGPSSTYARVEVSYKRLKDGKVVKESFYTPKLAPRFKGKFYKEFYLKREVLIDRSYGVKVKAYPVVSPGMPGIGSFNDRFTKVIDPNPDNNSAELKECIVAWPE